MPEAVAHTGAEERGVRRPGAPCAAAAALALPASSSAEPESFYVCGLGQFESEFTCLQALHYMIFDI